MKPTTIHCQKNLYNATTTTTAHPQNQNYQLYPYMNTHSIIDSMRDDWDNCHFFLIFCQILLPKNLTIMREIGQNLIRKTMYVTILIKIGLTYSKLMNKMLIFLWIFLNNMNSLLDLHSPLKMLININWSLRQNPGLFLPFRNQFLSKITY